MEINRQILDGAVTLTLCGRLDAAWSDTVGDALQQVLREGLLVVRLDLTSVTYVSSAGLRVLLAQWKELRRAKGSLVISAVSAEVERVLKLAGLGVLLEGKTPVASATDTPFAAGTGTSRLRAWKGPGFTGEIEELSPQARWEGKLVQPGERLSETQSFKLPQDTLALGLGAFGNSNMDSAQRLGEFLAVSGSAVYLPTDNTNRPDYEVTEGDMAPEVWLAEGLVAHGAFARLARFEAAGDADGVKMSDLLSNLLSLSGEAPMAFAAIVECVALVGAYRRRAPEAASTKNNFAFPGLRDWLTFTSEPSYQNTVTLLVGVATRDNAANLSAFTRPYDNAANLRTHVHAVVFPYRPVRHGLTDLAQTLSGLFDSKRIISVLHLLSDNRPEIGAGESRFYRGACWFGPLDIS